MCDRAGVDALWVVDHVAPGGGVPRLDAWTALVLGARDTSRARLGVMLEPMVRLPTVLAAMAQTLDAATGGRLELGVASDRVEDTEEYARTLRDLLADGPPLSIAIAGPRETGVAVRLADDVVIPASALQDVRALIGAIRAGCEAAGRDPASLGIAVDVPVSIGRTSAEAHARASHDPRFRDINRSATRGIFGTLEQCQDRVIALAHLGVTDLRCLLPNTPDVPDAIAQLTAAVVGTIDVLTPNSPRSKAPDPPEGWGGRPFRR
jgi:alkanesulfonate monooxygenase SsuD/methylene tetrahydromethanopterin reductase-like flavin-dependent oxidoreductase (luciferase family)